MKESNTNTRIDYDSVSHEQILTALGDIPEIEVVKIDFDTIHDRDHAFLPIISANKPIYLDHLNNCIYTGAPFRFHCYPASIRVRRKGHNPLKILFQKTRLINPISQSNIEDLVTFLEDKIGFKPLEKVTENEVRQGYRYHSPRHFPHPFLIYADKVGEITTENKVTNLTTNKISKEHIQFNNLGNKSFIGTYIEHIIKPLVVFCTDYKVGG